MVELGGGRRRASDPIDHSVGLELLLGLGASVEPDTPLARIHAADPAGLAAAEARIRAAYRIADAAARRHAAHPRADRLMPRAILLVIDSVGCGGAPDAADFGDEGANTLGHIAARRPAGLRALPNLAALGLGAAIRARLAGIDLPGFPETPDRRLGRRHRGLPRQGHPLRPLGTRRRPGALGLALFPAHRSGDPALGHRAR